MPPRTPEPMAIIRPPAPWSVPDSFDATRRPNSENTTVSTRPSMPRAVRSSRNAASARESVESCGSWLWIWLPCVSNEPQSSVTTRVPRFADSSVAASWSFCDRLELG